MTVQSDRIFGMEIEGLIHLAPVHFDSRTEVFLQRDLAISVLVYVRKGLLHDYLFHLRNIVWEGKEKTASSSALYYSLWLSRGDKSLHEQRVGECVQEIPSLYNAGSEPASKILLPTHEDARNRQIHPCPATGFHPCQPPDTSSHSA